MIAQKLSVAEYFAFERTQEIRYEYIKGELIPMLGDSLENNQIVEICFIGLASVLTTGIFSRFQFDCGFPQKFIAIPILWHSTKNLSPMAKTHPHCSTPRFWWKCFPKILKQRTEATNWLNTKVLFRSKIICW